MQEEVNQKVISLSIQGVKITASVLKAALRKFLEMDNRRKQETTQVKMAEKTGRAQEKGREKARKKIEKKKPHGKQTIKQLNAQGVQLSNIKITDALGGQVVHISPTSKDYINPMDINMDYSDDDNPLGVKSDFVLSLCELIMGSRDGIEAEEKSVIDRCLPLVYQKYFADPKPENMPVLGDLYDCLRKQKEPQAQRIATALEIYVNGSLKVFNHRTNVELNNRIVCFDIKELGKQLKKIGMLIVQDQVWNRVTINRGIKSTRYYIDEFHLLLKEEQTAAYSVEIWKRFRKWGGIPSGITQNIKDLLASREIENIFENSDFILMLNQAAGDRQILAKQLNISPYQLSYVTNSGEGEGLLFYGTTIIPFKDKFDKNLKLYSLMTTKPEEVEKREKEMEAEKHEGNR